MNSTVQSLIRVGVPYELIQKYVTYVRLLDAVTPRPQRQKRIQVKL